MSPRSIKPVIFLGFANDKEGGGFLRGLTKERNGIRQALRKLQEAGICEVITEPDLSIDRLFEVFQQYPNRIAAFHYGGHADSFELLLESQSGEKVRANSEGLVSFLGKQKGLELVFLNGCSSGKQAEALVKEGVPAVIGTSEKINDQIATGLAINFYQGLAQGRELQRAWEEAIDQANTRGLPGTTRSLDWDEEEESDEVIKDEFAWHLKTSSQYADAFSWSLPKAANNPLFGLDLDESYLKAFPKSPYPGLRPFKSEEARIFFGRGGEIRELYKLCHQDKPVVLLHGQAGVGKTSLVRAGLIPRSQHSLGFATAPEAATLPIAIRQALENHGRSLGLGPIVPDQTEANPRQKEELQKAIAQAEGYVKTLLSAELKRVQAQGSHDGSLASYWLEIEQITQKPLIVWVDHLENFEGWSASKIPERTWKEDLQAVQAIFSDEAPKGKLLLSYREPFHGMIQSGLDSAGILHRTFDLKPLDYDGIVEAVEGVADRPTLQVHFHLQIERSEGKYLPQIIADDLREDIESPLTPILQVILEGLWN
ncbi:MAG: AAA family ATPase, partial [Bacteroidota bacterium]